jgi:hypothetical protein
VDSGGVGVFVHICCLCVCCACLWLFSYGFAAVLAFNGSSLQQSVLLYQFCFSARLGQSLACSIYFSRVQKNNNHLSLKTKTSTECKELSSI